MLSLMHARKQVESNMVVKKTSSSALSHLVLAFHANQTGSALQNINSWESLYPPCVYYAGAASNQNPVLVFYVGHSGQNDLDAIRSTIETRWMQMRTKSCFSAMRVTTLTLNKSDDTHKTGSRVMFEAMISGKLDVDMKVVLFMEPDMRPVRPGWLAACMSEARKRDKFWIKGSIFRGDASKMHLTAKDTPYPPYFYHINGNALYNVGDTDFRQFYWRVRQYIVDKRGDSYNAYDTDIAEYLIDRRQWVTVRHVLHRFVFTDVIQNMWMTDYSVQAIVSSNPNTFLVHGGRQTLL
jgi:hypothetical protein